MELELALRLSEDTQLCDKLRVAGNTITGLASMQFILLVLLNERVGN